MSTDAPPLAGRKEWLGLAVLALPTLLLALDMSVLYLALPYLSADLGADSTQQLWIIDIYGFLIAGFLITMGNLGDRIGRSKLLMIGGSAFALTSVIAAYAPSAEALIASRAALGIAGATLMPSTLALISNMFRNVKQRGTAIGIWVSCFMVGGSVGPLIGGLLLEHFWWGSVFLLGLPVMVVLLITAPVLLPEFRNADTGRLDFTSVALSLGAILPVIYGIKELAKHGVDPTPIAAIGSGVVLGVVFMRRQRRLADPMLDVSLFGNRAFSASLMSMLLALMAFGAVMLFSIQYLQLVHGLTPFQAALVQLPGVFAMMLGTATAAAIAQRIRPAYVIGGGLALGVAVFGAVGTAVYRSRIGDAIPTELPAQATEAASDTLSGATAVATQLPSELGAQLISAAQVAFTAGLTNVAGLGVALLFGVALLALAFLRHLPPTGRTHETDDHNVDIEAALSAPMEPDLTVPEPVSALSDAGATSQTRRAPVGAGV